MSKVTIHSPTVCAPNDSAEQLAEFGTSLVKLSLDATTEIFRQGAALFRASMPVLKLSPSGGCCDIPELDCPPRCVCSISWEAARGEYLKAVIKVTNRSSQARTFRFMATPFAGAGTGAGLTVTPAQAELAVGQSVAVTAAITVGENFQPGIGYESEILIQGAYEQCVCVTLTVEPERVVRCTVDQGEPPVRLRADHWYHHFQCAEPCEKPRHPSTANPNQPTRT